MTEPDGLGHGRDDAETATGDEDTTGPETLDTTSASRRGLRPGEVAVRNAREDAGVPTWVWFIGLFLVIAVVAAGILALVAAVGETLSDSGETTADTGAPAMVVSLPPVEQGELTVGTCIDSDEYEKAVDGEAFTRLSCADPHDAEIYLMYEFPAGPYPGEETVQEEMRQRCDDEFWAYVGDGYDVDIEPLVTSTWWPTDTGWASGYRIGTCLLTGTEEGGKLTGSRYWQPGVAMIRPGPQPGD